jgi:hypothetical protein
MAKRPRPDIDQVRDAMRERDESTEDAPPEPPREDEDAGEDDEDE